MHLLKAFTPTASPCCPFQRQVFCSKAHLRSQSRPFAGTADARAYNYSSRDCITSATNSSSSSSCCSSSSRCCSSPQLTTRRRHSVATSAAAAAAGGFTDDHSNDFWTRIHVLAHHIREIVSSQYLPIALVCALTLGAVNPSLGLAASKMHIPALATFGIFVVQVRTQQPNYGTLLAIALLGMHPINCDISSPPSCHVGWHQPSVVHLLQLPLNF